MRKALLILLVAAFVVFVIGMSGVALATDPANEPTPPLPFTFTEGNSPTTQIPKQTTAGPTKWGASAWTYKDKMDASFKYEGSYLPFQYPEGMGVNEQGQYGYGYYEWDITTKDKGPHDGYDTASNKCKTCHAVHRATGTYRLMRVDNPEDSCNYCHIGDHKHSERGAYYRDAALTYTANGHTMGAGKLIPDSSVQEWLNTKTLSTTDSDGATVTVSYRAREYNPLRNKMFYITSERASYHDAGFKRVGPTYLTCLSCHQPHNADELIWKPTGYDTIANVPISLADGYKLLRASPSGSVVSTKRMVSYYAFGVFEGSVTAVSNPGDTTVYLKVPRSTFQLRTGDILEFEGPTPFTETVTADALIDTTPPNPVSVTALDNGIDTTWLAELADSNIVKVPTAPVVKDVTGTGISAAGNGTDMIQNAGVVWTLWKGSTFDPYDGSHGSPYAPRLSVWCADCHNLNIGNYEAPVGGTNWRSAQMHSDRTHTVPGRMECWSCHSTNMPKTDLDWEAYTGIAATPDEPGCNKCHYYSNGSAYYNEVRQEVPKSDFPHSGASTGFKLLMEDTPNTGNGVEASTQALDSLCLQCHDLIGTKM